MDSRLAVHRVSYDAAAFSVGMPGLRQRDHTVRLRDPATGGHLAAISLGPGVASCGWYPPDGSAAAAWDRNVVVLHVQTRRFVETVSGIGSDSSFVAGCGP